MKSEKTEDRRVRKTKHALQKGFAELLAEKEIQKITVKELTEKVDVHRGTFYAHYEDIYDLYRSIEDRVINEIKTLLSNDFPEGLKGLTSFYKLLFSYLCDNKQICRFLFQGSANNSFINTLNDLFLESCLDSWNEEYEIDKLGNEIEYYAQFYLSGSFAIISKWVVSDFKYPIEKLIFMLSEIDMNFGEIFKLKSNDV